MVKKLTLPLGVIRTDFIKMNGYRTVVTVATVGLLTLNKGFALSRWGKLLVARKTAN
jgi:hypothetical protein